ncbi:CotH kinase family protein [Acetobacter malorum]|uniref:CotH kinase family protein n=1 Tax=Acetobacter malorum TaxID=178901 RepID=UPI00248E939D|nr:CotH kinase family protein [Acetobacter malorum]
MGDGSLAKVSAPTTGVISNGGLIQIGVNNTADQWDYITLPKPSQPWRILIEGDVPTTSTTPAMSVSFFEGTVPLFSASGTWQMQGQSSQYANKKNWKLKLKNSATGNKLLVKIGDWEPMSSIILKGYGTDRTLIRDSLTTQVWRNMHAFPTGLLAPLSAYDYFRDADCGMHASALFSTAGTPVEVWRNGAFLGLYVLRTDNDAASYLMDTANTEHLLIQPQHAADMWTAAFNSAEWDFPSPDVAGYDTGDDMSQLAPTVNSAAARFVSWMQACVAQRTDIRSTYRDYLDLGSVLDYVLIVELSGSMDSLVNNWMAGSWNATPASGVWHFWPYDEDVTWGLTAPVNGTAADADAVGWVCGNQSHADHSPGFFNVIFNRFRPELRQRWRALRDAGIIDPRGITAWITSYTSLIDPAAMEMDLAVWSINGPNGAFAIAPNLYKQSLAYVLNYVVTRIAWIDAQWGYSGS